MGVVEEARHDWLLYTDPDELLPAALAQQVGTLLGELPDDVALVFAPIQYRFAGRPLRGGTWGGIKQRRLLVHRRRAKFRATIYSGTWLDAEHRATAIPFDGGNAIAHHWVAGYRDFLVKHRRYVRVNAEDRAANGEVTGLRKIATTPVAAFLDSLVRKRGYRDGLRGLALSALWAWYSTATELALRRRTKVGPAR